MALGEKIRKGWKGKKKEKKGRRKPIKISSFVGAKLISLEREGLIDLHIICMQCMSNIVVLLQILCLSGGGGGGGI